MPAPVLVGVKVVAGTPPAAATMVKPPAVPLAVKVGDVTVPPAGMAQTATVFTAARAQPSGGVPVNVALAPVPPGVIVNVTCPPATGSLWALLTVRLRALRKA